MTSLGSRIPGFYRLPLGERRREIARRSQCSVEALEAAVESGGLSATTADKVVENVLGIYGLPFGVALNFTVNGRDRLVPMVVEEPSVIAAASNAARMVRHSGGFQASMVESLMTAQVQVHGVADEEAAAIRLREASQELLQKSASAVPNLIARGGGPRSLDVRCLGEGYLVLHVYVDCKDAMGANLVNTIAEAIGPSVAQIANGSLGLRILSNLCDRRLVRVSCRVQEGDLVKTQNTSEPDIAPTGSLEPEAGSGLQAPGSGAAAKGHTAASWRPTSASSARDLAVGIERASRFAELDVYRAATHNKGVMNGIDAVCLATGNDFRAVEAGAHSYAARTGTYRPLALWKRHGEHLEGTLELPLALGVVGGTLRIHPTAKMAITIAGAQSADDLSLLAGAAGLASNLAALRALASEGIARGHMSLQARSVAVEAGAIGDEVEQVAQLMSQQTSITLETAKTVLRRLRDV